MAQYRLISVFLIVFITASAASGRDISLRVPTGNTYPPFFMQDNEGIWGGISIELAHELLDEAGMKPSYKPLPFPRALKYLEEGKLDMMLNLTVTKEREEYIHFIGPQLDETVVLVVKKDTKLPISCLDDFKNLPHPIGIERGKVYGPIFENKRKTDESFCRILDKVTDVSSNEKKLISDRLSGYLGYGYNTYYRLKNNPSYNQLKIHPFVINQSWVYFGFSKKSVSNETLTILKSAYKRASAKGRFERIRQRYIYKE